MPGCISDGETPEQAIRNGRGALKPCLLTKQEFGDAIPQPGSGVSASGHWRQRVPKSLHARLIATAEYESTSLNTLVTVLIAEGIGRRESEGKNRAISERPAADAALLRNASA